MVLTSDISKRNMANLKKTHNKDILAFFLQIKLIKFLDLSKNNNDSK